MPTGYTAAIADGISFAAFTLQCARAFGACVEMRDEPADTPIPDEFVAPPYHLEAAAKAHTELHLLQQMTETELRRAAAKDYDDVCTLRAAATARWVELRAKYEAMLAKVDAWVPPTAEHKRLQEFMQDQIAQSIRWDCEPAAKNVNPDHVLPRALLKPPAQYKAEHVERLQHDIQYHESHHAEEVKRAAERTAWMRALRESLTPRNAG